MALELYLDLYSQPCRSVYMFAKKNNIPFDFRKITLFDGEFTLVSPSSLNDWLWNMLTVVLWKSFSVWRCLTCLQLSSTERSSGGSPRYEKCQLCGMETSAWLRGGNWDIHPWGDLQTTACYICAVLPLQRCHPDVSGGEVQDPGLLVPCRAPAARPGQRVSVLAAQRHASARIQGVLAPGACTLLLAFTQLFFSNTCRDLPVTVCLWVGEHPRGQCCSTLQLLMEVSCYLLMFLIATATSPYWKYSWILFQFVRSVWQ